MNVRDFAFGDEPALQAVFHSAIHLTAARMRALRPFVVEDEGRIVEYADLQSKGYIDHFYVAGHDARRGVGRRLMDRIHARADERKLPRLFSDVSLTAQPFVARFGFACAVEYSRPDHPLVIGYLLCSRLETPAARRPMGSRATGSSRRPACSERSSSSS